MSYNGRIPKELTGDLELSTMHGVLLTSNAHVSRNMPKFALTAQLREGLPSLLLSP